MSRIILFRFDASATIGLGHAMRCYALIEGLVDDNIDVIVSAYQLPRYIEKKLRECGVNVKIHQGDIGSFVDQNTLLALALSYKISTVVLDGYLFNEEYRQAIKANISNVIAFDDTNELNHLYCDLVINALPTAKTLRYAASAPQAKHLLGLQYSILRADFLSEKVIPFMNRKKLFINFGGSDVGGLTLPTIHLLAKTKRFSNTHNVIIVTGDGCKNIKKIAKACQQFGFEHYHNSENIAWLMNQSALAICASGSMVYELAYCQVPSILLTVADNQKLSAQAHQAAGWCYVFDGGGSDSLALALITARDLWDDKIKLSEMSLNAGKLVDGRGVQRIANEIIKVNSVTKLNIVRGSVDE